MANIHLVGVGGTGLSAIATVLLQQGHTISGSDMAESVMIHRLEGLGGQISIGHNASNLPDSLDAVIISSAIPDHNPELVEAKARNIPVFKRDAWLGRMMTGKIGIAIAGTHGKTTTTALMAYLLDEMGLDPTYIVGGFVPQLATNAKAGNGNSFVIEADEYDYMFLGLHPTLAIITMVEWDHPDIFATEADFQQAFIDFTDRLPQNGLIIGCGDDPGVRQIFQASDRQSKTYGLADGNDWQAVDVRPNLHGGYDFKAVCHTAKAPVAPIPISLRLPGLHNVANTLATLVVAYHQGLDLTKAAEILGTFEGVGRRFELKGEVNGLTIVDDYAHHPTEIRATLQAARTRFGPRPIWALFQPHTFSRTLALFDEFVTAFSEADHAILIDIFPSREKDEGLVSSQMLIDKMSHPDCHYLSSHQTAADYLIENLGANDVLLTMGAGDGYQIGEQVLAHFQRNLS
ncbi:MAG: UDP-N-acetylmuramate--L-alanine ligase [Chloroflexota bacterium]